ncbi:MAG: glycosyltransferase family 2 protein [Alphaproteobacteria bacterium]|nr:glycosyltransferase family 2 protein [Alphaproteobacteria bacterium]
MIVAIIVTYNPDPGQFKRLLELCVPQVDAVVVVDNGSSVPVKAWLDACETTQIIWRPLGENKGIAAAHNEGIRQARLVNADYVLIFDHDSAPAPDMAERLLAALKKKQEEGGHVAAVGPCYTDPRRDNPPPFTRIEGLCLKRCAYSKDTPIVPVDYLVSSGSLIPVAALDAVGEMKEDLFIDYVDVEWGLRANAKGFQSFGVFSALMEHNLGDETIRIFGRKLAVHSSLRHYYMFRNATWLYTQKDVPLNWKLVDGARFAVRFVCYALFAKPHLEHIRNMTQGVFDGLRGRLGKKFAE